MAAKQTKRGRGRPPAQNPKAVQLNVRIDAVTRAALEQYEKRNGLDGLSVATRHALRRVLREEKLLD